MELSTIFESFALPVAVIIALMWYVVHQGKEYQDRIAELTKLHQEESKSYTASLNHNAEVISRNTVVLERLCTMLGDKDGTTNA